MCSICALIFRGEESIMCINTYSLGGESSHVGMTKGGVRIVQYASFIHAKKNIEPTETLTQDCRRKCKELAF
jgi:hypothetical protein